MTQTLTPDICVIGAGAGGLAAAMEAAAFGKSVVLIERDRMGGAYLNTACIPSKAMLACAKRRHDVQTAARFGVRVGESEIDFKVIAAHIQASIEAMAPNSSVARLNGLGVDIFREDARFTDATTVIAGSAQIKARHFIIATGSRPSIPQIPGLNRIPYLTEETVRLHLQRFPHVMIVGGRATGIELAQGLRRLGSVVTVLEPGMTLPRDDGELRGFALKFLADEGVRVIENTRVERMENFGSTIQIVFSMQNKPFSIEGSHVVLAMDRTPNAAGLNLDAAGIKVGERGIGVNGNLQTSNPRVYAVGDVTGELMFTHAASSHGAAATRHALFGTPIPAAYDAMPWVTFTDPEIAHVGLTEETARNRYGQLSIVRWPYFENERAHAIAEIGGFVKVIASKRGQILGAGVAGAQAGELIQMWSLAMQKGLTLKHMSEIVSPYPTLSDLNRRAALNQLGPMIAPPSTLRVKGLLAKLR